MAGLIASRQTSAHVQHPASASASAQALTVSATPTGRAIAPGFLGLSLEYTAVPAYAGKDPKAVDPVFEQLIRNLAPGAAPDLRIGGDTTDWTWWPVPGVAKPGGIRYSLNKNWLGVTAALAHAVGARVILSTSPFRPCRPRRSRTWT